MKNDKVSKLKKYIKNLKTGFGLSQDEFTRKADMTYATLNNIQIGVIKKVFGKFSSEDCESIKYNII